MNRFEFRAISPIHMPCERCSAPTFGRTFVVRDVASHWPTCVCARCILIMFDAGTASNPRPD